MRTQDKPYRSRHNAITYLLTCAIISGLSVLTFKYDMTPHLVSAFSDLASNLTSAL